MISLCKGQCLQHDLEKTDTMTHVVESFRVGARTMRPTHTNAPPDPTTWRPDCVAAAAMYRHEGRGMNTEPPLRFLIVSLKVDYLRPTPIEVPLGASDREGNEGAEGGHPINALRAWRGLRPGRGDCREVPEHLVE